jgi:hypothetical protein
VNLSQAFWDRYYDLGWALIPIRSGTKKPFPISWEKYQQTRPTEEQIHTWAKTWPKAGIACLTGAVSGVVVFDIDQIPKQGSNAQEQALIDAAHALVAKMPRTATSRTSKGRHLFFRHPGMWVPTKAGFLPGLDIRGDGGYAVLPPSVHPSGWVYAWEIPPEDGIADLPYDLYEAARRHDLSTSTSSSPLYNDSLGTWRSALLGTSEGGTAANPMGRNESATKVIGKLLKSTDTELWPLQWEAVKNWNLKNVPPLSERELRTTFDSIAKTEKRKRDPSLAQGVDLASILDADLPVPPTAVPKFLSGLTLLSAKPKIGKSILALQVALSITPKRSIGRRNNRLANPTRLGDLSCLGRLTNPDA